MGWDGVEEDMKIFGPFPGGCTVLGDIENKN